MKMNRKNIYKILIFLTLLSCGNNSKKEFVFNGKMVSPPVSTYQLSPAIFFPKDFFRKLKIEEGMPVRIFHGNKWLDLRVYKFFGKKNTFAIHKKFADKLSISKGENKLKIKIISLSETDLKPKPIGFDVENYKGDLSKWKGFAFGAPHGDCDFETGSVVKIVSENYGIPSTAAYGCRVSYRGIWYDCNRPLMKEPKKDSMGVKPIRVWNAKAEEKYRIYQDSVWKNSNLKYGERFELFTSFHGHDLTVKLPNGKKIERPVIEGIGVGFTKNQLRKIKNFYYQNAKEYWKNPPDLYFGNLPEDRTYEQFGVKLQFFYSGLGTRTYGSLRSDICKHALHFETPNSLRTDKKVQPSTAKFLADLYSFIRDNILNDEKVSGKNKVINFSPPKDLSERIIIPAGEFLMGAADNEGWSSEHPQHMVYLDEYAIDKYEVTNKEYCKFLNDAYLKKIIKIKENGIYDKNGNLLFDLSNPFSEIFMKNGKFFVKKSRDYFPVVFVTYYGAKAFAQFYNADLPTEAEWEKAATWSNGRKFFYSVSKNQISETDANFEDTNDPFENLFPATSPVGFYSTSSPYGIKDMSGNVWEWCKDTYDYSVYKKRNGSTTHNPCVNSKGTMKSIRGGAWNTEFYVTRGTMRLGINPKQSLVNLGFRCVYHNLKNDGKK